MTKKANFRKQTVVGATGDGQSPFTRSAIGTQQSNTAPALTLAEEHAAHRAVLRAWVEVAGNRAGLTCTIQAVGRDVTLVTEGWVVFGWRNEFAEPALVSQQTDHYERLMSWVRAALLMGMVVEMARRDGNALRIITRGWLDVPPVDVNRAHVVYSGQGVAA